MKCTQSALTFMLAVVIPLWLSGCNRTANHSQTKPTGDESAEHDHEHHHHGPHNGHMMELGDEEYHAEWTHDESGKVTFYILDSEAKKDVPISADKIAIDVKIGENPPKTYELTAVDPTDGKASAFEIVDKPFEGLFDQLNKTSSIALTLHVNINGKQFDTPVKEHEHGH